MSTVDVVPVGAFEESLIRNNSKIRADRGRSIKEDAQLEYQRKLQDMEVEIRRLNRKRENMLDLSPTNADNLMLGEDFDAKKFADLDVEIGVKLENLTIKMKIGSERFKYLYGTEFVSSLNPTR